MRGAVFFGLGLAAGAGALALALTADPPAPGPAAGVPPGPAPEAPVGDVGSDDADGDASTPALRIDGPVTPERAMEIVRQELERASGGGSYPGRFAYLSLLGRPGVDALVEFASLLHPADRESLAQLAIQALGDIDLLEVVPALEVLAVRLREASAGYYVVDEVAHSLFRRGAREMLVRTIQDLERLWPMAGLGSQGADLDRLALCYFHADRFQDAVRTYRGLAQRYPQQCGIHLYNAACVWSRAGEPKKALESLREAIEGKDGDRFHYDDVEWMQVDGDLAAARKLPGFEYLVACCIARDRIDAGRRTADPADVRAALDAMARAGGAGYRIEHQHDRLGMLIGLRDHPEFERLWTAMGGTRE